MVSNASYQANLNSTPLRVPYLLRRHQNIPIAGPSTPSYHGQALTNIKISQGKMFLRASHNHSPKLLSLLLARPSPIRELPTLYRLRPSPSHVQGWRRFQQLLQSLPKASQTHLEGRHIRINDEAPLLCPLPRPPSLVTKAPTLCLKLPRLPFLILSSPQVPQSQIVLDTIRTLHQKSSTLIP